MNPYFPHLFSPLKVKKTVFKNRIFAGPTGLKELTDHWHLVTKNIDYLKRRAQGGAASVCLGDVQVDVTGDISWNPKVRAWDKENEPGFYDMAGAIRSQGAHASMELVHAGMHFHEADRINYGPSDMIDEFDQGDGYGIRRHKIIAMPREIIDQVVDSYGKAALRAKHCGFTSVLLHAGHGWLPAQFLSPVLNHREDEFGGSLENRARFTMMVVDKIREYCGPNFIIEARISWKEGMYDGYQLEDSIRFCEMLEEHGVDMIQVSCGSLHFHDSTILSCPSWFDVEEGHNLKAAEEIKKHVKIPVGTVGAVTDPGLADKWIEEGKVDYIIMARALLADPDFPKKAMHGNVEDIRPCLRCLSCMTGGYFNLPIHCSVNPQIGRDSDYKFAPLPTEKKRVLIAGGGPAGMEAAITASRRGHEVILCEKDSALGGLLQVVEKESFKKRIGMYKEYLEYELGKSAVDIRLNTVVTPELVKELRPDVLIAAVGGHPIIPPIKGIEKAVQIVDYYRDESEVGENVLVLGGGFAGVECAIGLALAGKKSTIIEMSDALASGPNTPYPGTGAMQIDALWTNVKKNNVQVMLNTKCVEITDEGMICEDKDGNRIELKADKVIAATGIAPNEATVDELRETVIDFEWIGDCNQPGLIRTAVRDGYDAALNL
ncbi:FAD-dependent oxidoreductase [Mediterraneibacter faecis]|uniref:oxidoreductase n=1 Tax=Mediterraneibacter faecis TaxID=592978 RepID=UPI001D013012|nr:FAD-dependent oxidoreductase [Mediterraneibacter faecis]MCB5754512.1 FAD-dependent oxidoreductase [Mediterraneibacter faecis]